jgi:two-component system, NarL family, response regulator DegU
METNKITVYIADDHNVVREAMVRLLSTFDRVKSVKEAHNGRELVELVKRDPPHAVILDVEMPVMTGTEATRYLTQHYPDVKILILTMHTEEFFIQRLLLFGAHGILTKAAPANELEKALYSIVDLDFYKNGISEKAITQLKHNTGSPPEYFKLTPREEEILLLICQDYTSKEISDRLDISEKTYFNHRANILNKAGVKGNVGLLRYALTSGLFKVG